MQAPGGPKEDETGGFTYGGWVFHYSGDDDTISNFMDIPFELLLGKRTYDIFASYWPTDKDSKVGKKLMRQKSTLFLISQQTYLGRILSLLLEMLWRKLQN